MVCTLLDCVSIRKKVSRGGNSGRIYLPKEWVGRDVVVILLNNTPANFLAKDSRNRIDATAPYTIRR